MMNIKRINNAPVAQAQPIKRLLPTFACRRIGGASGPIGGFPVGFPHWAQNAASFGNSKLQCVQFMFVISVMILHGKSDVASLSPKERNTMCPLWSIRPQRTQRGMSSLGHTTSRALSPLLARFPLRLRQRIGRTRQLSADCCPTPLRTQSKTEP